MRILSRKQRNALFDVMCLGQYDGTSRPTRKERKAAKWASKAWKDQIQFEEFWKDMEK